MNIIRDFRIVKVDYKYDEKYERFNKKYNYLDDGKASKRVIEVVIKQEDDYVKDRGYFKR